MSLINIQRQQINLIRSQRMVQVGMCIAAIFSLLLSGCAKVGPDFVKPEVPVTDEWTQTEGIKRSKDSVDTGEWWESFHDPVLSSVVRMAYKQNLDLQASGLRILQARAQLGIAIGSLYPQQQAASGDYSANRGSENLGVPILDNRYESLSIGFDAAWELDVWGKYRRSVESGLAQLEATIAGYDDMLVTVTAEAARNYIIVRTLEKRLEIARENVAIQKKFLLLVQARFKGGEVSKLDVNQSRSLLRTTQALIPRIESSLRQSKNALAILLGTLPGEIDSLIEVAEGAANIPVISEEVLVELPAELLRRRPDIRLAEMRIAAQSPQVGVAKAGLYPHFSLFGSIGWQAVSSNNSDSAISDIFTSKSLFWTIGPSFSWDIFNYGRIKNKVRSEDAKLQEVIVNYRNTVIKAQNEVENSMAAFAYAKDEKYFLADSVDNARQAVELSLLQYEDGQVDFQRVLDSQRLLTEQADILAEVIGRVSINVVALYKAMGGGWQIRNGEEFVDSKTREEMCRRTDWGNLLEPAELTLAEPTPLQAEQETWLEPVW